jgi:hypothetical protein
MDVPQRASSQNLAARVIAVAVAEQAGAMMAATMIKKALPCA